MASAEIRVAMDLLEKRCANCDIFVWEQVDPVVSPLRRCTGCWKISYCSRECQEEHWRKVHKAHCKFFSGAKRLEGNDLHQKDTCTHCILQKEAGAEVFKQDNPNYICLLNNKTPSGRVLLALHGRYPIPSAWNRDNRVERIIDLLQRLLLKIQATKQPVYQLYPKDVEKISEELSLQNIFICLQKATLPQNYQREGHKSEHLSKLITEDLKKTPPGDLWDMFLLLIEILYMVESVKTDGLIKKPDKSLPKAQRPMSKKVRESSFLQVVDKILEALQERLVSIRELAAIICEDNLERECSACKKGIVIQTFASFGIMWVSRAPCVLLGPGLEQLFSCGDKACTAKLIMVGGAELRSWNMAINAVVSQLAPTRCDSCFLLAPVKEVHRSECLTRNYCGKDCLLSDQAAHAVCCKLPRSMDNVDQRKVKKDGRARAEKANKSLENYQRRSQAELQQKEHSLFEAQFSMVTDKVKKVKIGGRKKEGMLPEVD